MSSASRLVGEGAPSQRIPPSSSAKPSSKSADLDKIPTNSPSVLMLAAVAIGFLLVGVLLAVVVLKLIR